MFSKIFSSISALLVVMMTIFPANKVEAQALLEFALILGLVGVNTNEGVEFYWNPAPPIAAPINYGGFDEPTVVYLDVTETVDSDCTQSILIPMSDTKPVTIAVSHVKYVSHVE